MLAELAELVAVNWSTPFGNSRGYLKEERSRVLNPESECAVSNRFRK